MEIIKEGLSHYPVVLVNDTTVTQTRGRRLHVLFRIDHVEPAQQWAVWLNNMFTCTLSAVVSIVVSLMRCPFSASLRLIHSRFYGIKQREYHLLDTSQCPQMMSDLTCSHLQKYHRTALTASISSTLGSTASRQKTSVRSQH